MDLGEILHNIMVPERRNSRHSTAVENIFHIFRQSRHQNHIRSLHILFHMASYRGTFFRCSGFPDSLRRSCRQIYGKLRVARQRDDRARYVGTSRAGVHSDRYSLYGTPYLQRSPILHSDNGDLSSQYFGNGTDKLVEAILHGREEPRDTGSGTLRPALLISSPFSVKF